MALTTAMVTGASSGIGYEISKVLAEAGHDLVLVARRQERLQQLAEYLQQEYSIKAHVFAIDLCKLDEIDRLHAQLEHENIPVDILVNNAGLGVWGPFTANGQRAEINEIQLNVTALTYLCKRFATDMVKRGLGKILNIASIAAYMPSPYMAVYNATKAYVVSFSEALRVELKGTGVSVTVSCPGPTESEFHQAAGTVQVKPLRLLPFMSSEQVARISVAGMNKRKGLVVPGVLNRVMTLLPRLAPVWLLSWVGKLIFKPR